MVSSALAGIVSLRLARDNWVGCEWVVCPERQILWSVTEAFWIAAACNRSPGHIGDLRSSLPGTDMLLTEGNTVAILMFSVAVSFPGLAIEGVLLVQSVLRITTTRTN